MSEWSVFFKLHSGLPREGPGDPADIPRVREVLGGATISRIADVGCGPGGDIDLLLKHFPEARVTAVDLMEHFIEAVRQRHGKDARVETLVGDMADVSGPFDLIWSMGSLYFLGLEAGLATMREKLAQNGVIAFSYPCHATRDPSEDAVSFWGGETVGDRDWLVGAVKDASFSLLADWAVADVGWTLYYAPMMARVARLRAGADAALTAVLDKAETEHETWRQVRDETGYRMVVARRHDH